MQRRDALILRLFAGLAWLTDRLACLGLRPAATTTNVLVVRLDAIGDFLLWADAARCLALHYRGQGRRVILLANAQWAELAESLGVFDAVWRLDRRRFLFDVRYRFATIRKIRRAGFALAVQPTFSRELLFGDAVMRIAGWQKRIGSVGDLSNMNGAERQRADRWYSALLAAAATPMMEIDRNVEFLAGLGIAAKPRIGHLPALPESDSAAIDGDYVVLFPGASWDAKRWPPESFAALAERIVAATGWQAVLAGADGDRPAAAAIAAAASLSMIDRVGATDLTALARLLQGARLVVSNDTSAVHLAAVVGTPSVCIVGGGHFGRFLPYSVVDADKARAPHVVDQPMDCFGCNWVCRYPRGAGEAFACIRAVSVDQVWTAVAPLLPGRLVDP